MTQRVLAHVTGVPQPSIARIESGASVPRVDTFQRLLRATGTDLEVEPRLGGGVDRGLIRITLAMTPDERGRSAIRAGRNLATLLAETRGHDRADRS